MSNLSRGSIAWPAGERARRFATSLAILRWRLAGVDCLHELGKQA
jgi:hypothetical protein